MAKKPVPNKKKISSDTAKQIEVYEHKSNKRLNNPQVGLVNSKTENVKEEKTKNYVYDPHLDPSLQWSGKSEHSSFQIPTVSLHVHERIDPRAIIETVKKSPEKIWQQMNLFNKPINKLSFLKEIEFYKHQKDWSNRIIAGDSLLVMNSLIEKEGMAEKVQMIYFDPPYGVKYGSNFQPFINKRDVSDGKDSDLNQEPEMIRAFRDTWQLGIHSYLTYIRDRLLLSRDLITESGSIFLQISDQNVHHVRELMDEVFGSKNFVSQIFFQTTSGFDTNTIATVGDYILWYAKNKEKIKINKVYQRKNNEPGGANATWIMEPHGFYRGLTAEEKSGKKQLSETAILYSPGDLQSQGAASIPQPFNFMGRVWNPNSNSHWKANYPDGINRLARCGRVHVAKNSLQYRRLATDFPYTPITNTWTDTQMSSFGGEKLFVVKTNPKVIERCMQMATDPGDLVFDPTCGSGTTAVVAEEWGRRWITCDTSRIAVTITKQRILTELYPFYQLKQSEEGVDSGFEYDSAERITLKSIATNAALDPICEKFEKSLNDGLASLCKSLGREISFSNLPEQCPDDWSKEAKDNFLRLKQSFQRRYEELDYTIRQNAEKIDLVDKPKIDSKKARVSGPFTVEAVPAPAVREIRNSDQIQSFSGPKDWTQELLKSGVRVKNGKFITFARLELLAGTRWLHAEGATDEKNPQRVVVSFGPDFAPLEQRQVELALLEAEKIKPSPTIIVFAAFQFDPEAAKDIDQVNWGGVSVLKVQMNADLFTDDLKKKRSSNESFWLIGQPDINVMRIRSGADAGKFKVSVNGFDYYNPTTGTVFSGASSQIAMWLLDTDYDGRSLLPKQIFFPMSDEKTGWAKISKVLKNEIDEELIEAFRGTESLPFEAGENKKIAIKIVDDRGIESLLIQDIE